MFDKCVYVIGRWPLSEVLSLITLLASHYSCFPLYYVRSQIKVLENHFPTNLRMYFRGKYNLTNMKLTVLMLLPCTIRLAHP